MKAPSKNEAFHKNLETAKADRQIPKVGTQFQLLETRGIILKAKNLFSSFVEAGLSLLEFSPELEKLKQNKNYKLIGFSTWNECCETGIEASERWVNEAIRGAQIRAALPKQEAKKITSVSQTRALAKVHEEKRADVVKEASKDGEATPKKIADASAKIAEKIEAVISRAPVAADFRVVDEPEETPADVDEVSGEIAECQLPSCKDARRLVKVLERKIRAANLEIGRLREDKEKEMERSKFYDPAVKVFNYWKEKTGHSKSKFGLDVFKLILPFLKSDGEDLCMMAVEGIAFQHYKGTRLNGTEKKYDSFELCFRNRSKFEEYCCRSPRFKKQKAA